MIAKRKSRTARSSRKSGLSFGRLIYKTILLVFFGVVIYVLFFSRLLAISSISVSGEKEISPDLISEKIKSEINGKYLGIFERNNLLLVRGDKLERDMKEQFKKIEDVWVEKKFPNAISVRIKEREMALFFSSGGKIVMIDENGVAYEEAAPELLESETMDNIILKDESQSQISLGKNILGKDLINYLWEIKNKLRSDCGLEIGNDYETPSVVSSDIRVSAAEGFRIFFNAEISVKKEIDMLNVFLENKLEKDRRADLEYVDLRSDNKVFYKFKDGAQNNEEIKPADADTNSAEVKGDSDKKDKKKKKK